MSQIDDVFKKFNSESINYAILRGYLNNDELYSSKDIDIYIDKKSLKDATSILKKYGFKKPKINACNYPHVQYVNIIKGELVKFDFVTGLNFGKNLDKFYRKIDFNKDIIMYNGKKVFNHNLALQILFLHIVYDKGILSSSNEKRLKEFYKLYSESKFELDLPDEFKLIFENLNTDVDKKVQELNAKKYNSGLLIEFKDAKKEIRKTNCNCKWRYRIHRLHRKSVAILGVDGSGKSTTIKALSESLGDSCIVQYMGFKDMETKWGEKYESTDAIKPKILRYFYVWKEMKYRYKKNRYNSSRLIIFDRFPWEGYDNSSGKYKPVYWMLFKVLFPRPKKIYYMYCSEETSLKRKDDIKDKNLFVSMKHRFDKKYKNKYMSFNTDEMNTDEIINQISKDLMKTNMFEYLF